MKLNLTRRDFTLVAAQMLGAPALFAQTQRQVNLGTFGSIDAQNYIRAKGLAAKTFGPTVKTEFVTVRAGSEVISAMAGGSLDICNLGSSPLVVGYAVERWGSWNVAFYITAIVYASGAVAWLAIDPTLAIVAPREASEHKRYEGHKRSG